MRPGALAVARGGSPLVVPLDVLVRPFADHGLDRERVPDGHEAVRLAIFVV